MVVENTIGMLKNRFPILAGRMRHTPQIAVKIIIAAACLHNFAISRGDMWLEKGAVNNIDPHDPADDYVYTTAQELENLATGRRVRDDIVNRLFS